MEAADSTNTPWAETVDRLQAMDSGDVVGAALDGLAAFIADLEPAERVDAVTALAAARPTMAAVRNGLETALRAVEADRADAAATVLRVARDVAQDKQEATRRIALLAQSYIRGGDAILTHCVSTQALTCIQAANQAGKAPRVFVTETRPRFQGRLAVRWLAGHGVPSTLVVDSAAYHTMRRHDVAMVVLGSDAIDRDGSLFNKVGTAPIAMAASGVGIPVYAAADDTKLARWTARGTPLELEERPPSEVALPTDLPEGAAIENIGFDRTPSGLITEYWTPGGALPPTAVGAWMDRAHPSS